MPHEATDDWTGNLIFYQSYGTRWYDRLCTKLVQHFTHGPYVHCEIFYGKNTNRQYIATASESDWITIGAHSNGIKYGVFHASPDHLWQIVTIRTLNTDETGTVLPLDRERLAYALQWAAMHLNVSYSWWDNVDQGLDILCPWNKIHLVERDHFNCSNFAAAFLLEAGIRLPRSFTFPFNVSPNDLAEWLGLLPERRRITL